VLRAVVFVGGMMKTGLIAAGLTLCVLLAAGAIFVATGAYDVGADAKHTRLVAWFLEAARERSIAARTAQITVPELRDPERIRRGAGNYDAMCAPCHLAPGAAPTELSRGLYPHPPDLTKAAQTDPARAFWIIKHGIKATGMPAWGQSIEDQYLWDMTAFVLELPELTPEQYAAAVRASGGHSHGGTPSEESAPESHTHEDDEAEHTH
jgi:mono/diheme cytochrome c family protein